MRALAWRGTDDVLDERDLNIDHGRDTICKENDGCIQVVIFR